MILNLISLLICVSIVASQTTAPSVAPCPATVNDPCKNGGFCVLLFGVTVSCTCPVSFENPIDLYSVQMICLRSDLLVLTVK
jgi:hypothetical protein